MNRGWVKKELRDIKERGKEACPEGVVEVRGLLRSGDEWKKRSYSPDSRPDLREWYFPDVKEMAGCVGAQPVWVEETMGEWFLRVGGVSGGGGGLPGVGFGAGEMSANVCVRRQIRTTLQRWIGCPRGYPLVGRARLG